MNEHDHLRGHQALARIERRHEVAAEVELCGRVHALVSAIATSRRPIVMRNLRRSSSGSK